MQYFVTVADELHFGRAAARLHIAQPSLSQQVQRLEQQLGVTLLDRTSRGVELTPAGGALQREGRDLLADAQRVLRATRSSGSDRLTVGFYGSAGALLCEVMDAFGRRHPAVEVSVRELLFGRIEDVLGIEVDVAFTRLLPGQTAFETKIVTQEPRVVALPATHSLAGRDSLRFADLRSESFITNPIVDDAGPPARWLAEQHRHGLSGRVGAEASSVQEILTLVATGRGVCLVPATVARQHQRADVRYLEVADAETAVVSVLWSPNGARPAIDAFIGAAREVAARHLGG